MSARRQSMPHAEPVRHDDVPGDVVRQAKRRLSGRHSGAGGEPTRVANDAWLPNCRLPSLPNRMAGRTGQCCRCRPIGCRSRIGVAAGLQTITAIPLRWPASGAIC